MKNARACVQKSKRYNSLRCALSFLSIHTISSSLVRTLSFPTLSRSLARALGAFPRKLQLHCRTCLRAAARNIGCEKSEAGIALSYNVATIRYASGRRSMRYLQQKSHYPGCILTICSRSQSTTSLDITWFHGSAPRSQILDNELHLGDLLERLGVGLGVLGGRVFRLLDEHDRGRALRVAGRACPV